MELLHNGKPFAEIREVTYVKTYPELAPVEETGLLSGPISFSFTAPLDEGIERALNWLSTVPEEWDLFIRQCLEKYPLD